jgi:hypothetical protein
VIHFLFDKGRNPPYSTAHQEWQAAVAQYPRWMARVYRHVLHVDAAASLTSVTLRQAVRDGGNPQLYWWEAHSFFGARGVGAFYIFDGADLVIVLVGMVSAAVTWPRLHADARARI